jgi:isopentenyl diphosphate isomerase/L-lactate dehydrogenase-like FMN-dependent dehydrogenase
MFDSGVRNGPDIFKAICLGAKAVLVGRPWVYGLAIAGKAGAKQVLTGMLAVSSCSSWWCDVKKYSANACCSNWI